MERLSMRKIRDVLRLKFDCGLTDRQPVGWVEERNPANCRHRWVSATLQPSLRAFRKNTAAPPQKGST